MPYGSARGDSSVTFDAATLGVGDTGTNMLGEILMEVRETLRRMA